MCAVCTLARKMEPKAGMAYLGKHFVPGKKCMDQTLDLLTDTKTVVETDEQSDKLWEEGRR